ncbi:MAG: ABC transporter substrate-binding protein [Anaerolineae bacterium]|nr:ABC transporter substrate-binding protein [Anaerolineae bacterium]
MYKHRIWALLTGLLVLAVVLASCGATATPEPTATEAMTEPTATEAMAEPTATEAMGEAPSGLEGIEADIGGTVSILAVWSGEEQDSFMAMLQPLLDHTGIEVEYTASRDINAILTTQIEGGNPPDVAGLPGPGQLREFAAEGHLVALNDILDMDALQQNYDEGFLDQGMVDGQLYGFFAKASVKSFIWYSPPAFEAAGYEIPTTWEELNALEQQIIDDGATPWCIGLESGAATGWPGTDWIEDIMLRTAGVDTYDQWWQHEIPWTDDTVRNAWETWGTVVGDQAMIYGGTPYVLSTNFGEAPFPLFDDPPGCYLHRQASFITGFIEDQFPDLEAGTGYNFFEFPPIDEQHGNPLLIAGDLMGVFNDTPQSRAVAQWLVSADAQRIWAERGGFLAPNKQVDPSVYPDQITVQIGELLTQATAVRFDASDLMPEAVNSSFWSGIVDFVSDPSQLDSILQSIESAAESAY